MKMNTKEILSKLGKQGKALAKEHFNKNYSYQIGPQFSQLVTSSVNYAFRELGQSPLEETLKNNVANAVAEKFDR
jgi:hypothetical protein